MADIKAETIVTPTTETKIRNEEDKQVMINELTEGFLGVLNTPLEDICMRLLELQQSQEVLLSTLKVEREKLEAMPFLQGILDTMAQVGPYYQKAQNLKKNMNAMSERINKMKKRAEKLQAKKENELIAAAEKQRQEQEKEAKLLAQPSKSLMETQPATETQTVAEPLPSPRASPKVSPRAVSGEEPESPVVPQASLKTSAFAKKS